MSDRYSINERIARETRDELQDKIERANKQRIKAGKRPHTRVDGYAVAVKKVTIQQLAGA